MSLNNKLNRRQLWSSSRPTKVKVLPKQHYIDIYRSDLSLRGRERSGLQIREIFVDCFMSPFNASHLLRTAKSRHQASPMP